MKDRPPSLGDLKDLPDLSPTSALAIVTFSESMFISLCAREKRLNSKRSEILPSVQLVQDAISVIAAVVATIKQTFHDGILKLEQAGCVRVFGRTIWGDSLENV